MKDQLNDVINAYLSPDKKTSLASALEKVEDIDALVAAAKEEADGLMSKNTQDMSEDDVSLLQTCTEIMVAAKTRKEDALAADQEAAKSQKETTVAELKEKIAAMHEAEETAKTDNEIQVATPEVATETISPPSETVAVQEEKVLVGAGAGSPSTFSSIASLPSGPLPPQTARGVMTATFATSSSGVLTDNKIEDMSEIATAAMAQLRSYPTGMPGNGQKTFLAAYKRKDIEEFTVHGRDSDAEVIDNVVAKGPVWDRTEGQFAAGWCAPSENLYELCPYVTSLDGIVDIPEVVASRGGVRYTSGPNFSALYDNASVGQILTEAQVIAGTTKTCIEVDCPPFTEVRLDVNPLCVTGNLLTQAGYPEYVERFIREAIAANAHKINLNVLTRMVTASTAVTVVNPPATTGVNDTSTASQFLDWASLYAEWLRNRYRLSFDSLIEVVAPHWYLQHMQADLARRTGVDLLTSEARLRSAFAERNIRIQWVYDWQPVAATAAGALTRPVNAQILVFIPGTFVKLTSPVINLGTVHSAAQLALNQYTALFVEEGFNVIERCFESLAVTIPTCPSGTTGAASGSCDSTP